MILSTRRTLLFPSTSAHVFRPESRYHDLLSKDSAYYHSPKYLNHLHLIHKLELPPVKVDLFVGMISPLPFVLLLGAT
jgi:hypothetical protein